MADYPGLSGWPLNETKAEFTQRRGEGQVTPEADTEVRWTQAKEWWQPPAWKRARNRFSPKPLEGARPCSHPDFCPVILSLDVQPPEL